MERLPLWPHQARAKKLLDEPATMLAWEMGTGKTRPVVEHIAEASQKKSWLIICPKSVCRVWRSEVGKYAPELIDFMAVLDTGSTDKNMQIVNAQKYRMIVINYESVWRGELGERIARHVWGGIVCDEIHRIKSHDGRASRFVAKLRAQKRIGLSGTPMPKDYLDVFGQYRFLDPSIFGDSFHRFKNRYAIMGGHRIKTPRGFKPVQIVGWQNIDELKEKFHYIADRVQTDEVLSLPEKMHVTRFVQLGKEAQRIYNALEKDFVVECKAGNITAANGGVKVGRMQQVTGGCAYLEAGGISQIDDSKQKELQAFFGDIGKSEPVVVFCNFIGEIDQVHKAAETAGRWSYELSGRKNQYEKWLGNEKKSGSVIVAQIRAGGVGVDMSAARYCVYWSTGWTPGDYEQSEARVYRQGQTRKVLYVHLIAQGTVDETISHALRARISAIDAVVNVLSNQEKHNENYRRTDQEIHSTDEHETRFGSTSRRR